jgi:hypothetical protein
MEFCEGGKVDDLNYMKDHGIAVEEVYIANLLYSLYLCVCMLSFLNIQATLLNGADADFMVLVFQYISTSAKRRFLYHKLGKEEISDYLP